MVSARLSEDGKWIMLNGEPIEMQQIRLSFTKKVNSWFMLKKQNPDAKVEESFINHLDIIPRGLWIELVNVCTKFNFPLYFLDDFNDRIKDPSVTRERFDAYIADLFGNSTLSARDYQRDGVFNMLAYKNCCIEVSTSGGKTFMAYMLFRYMIDVVGIRHILFVTPGTNLTEQSAEKFIQYDHKNGKCIDWTYGTVSAKSKSKKKNSDDIPTIVFGNYQSLRNKSDEYLSKFDVVIVDECHHARSYSIKSILHKCSRAQYKIGMTGTFPEQDSYDNFTLQSYIGPVVFRLSSYSLINEKNSATPVHVNMLNLRYLDNQTLNDLFLLRNVSKKDDPAMGTKILNREKEVMRDNPDRFYYICSMLSKTTKNTLVIFSDIQNEYGRRIYNYIKDKTPKNAYYIDGNTNEMVRQQMKDAMEADLTGNTIIVASMGCFSEGIDICNMFNIFIVETTKSAITLAQILGRGMRLFEGKERTIVIDFVDDYRYGDGFYVDNYLYKHGMERYKIYQEKGFPCNIVDVDLRATTTQKRLF